MVMRKTERTISSKLEKTAKGVIITATEYVSEIEARWLGRFGGGDLFG